MPAPDSVILETSLGNIQLELYWDHAPRVRLRLLDLDPGARLQSLDIPGRPARTLHS
jgi:hypothetical protein